MRDDLALDDAVARVDFGDLADRDVLGLRLGDAQLGLQVRRVGDAREVGARRDLLADFDRHTCSTPVMPALTLRSSSCRTRSS